MWNSLVIIKNVRRKCRNRSFAQYLSIKLSFWSQNCTVNLDLSNEPYCPIARNHWNLILKKKNHLTVAFAKLGRCPEVIVACLIQYTLYISVENVRSFRTDAITTSKHHLFGHVGPAYYHCRLNTGEGKQSFDQSTYMQQQRAQFVCSSIYLQ